MKPHVPLGQFPKLTTMSSYTLKTSLLYTRCLLAVNVTCLKSQVGLLQTAHSWANGGVLLGARVRRRVAFETIKLIDAKVLCTIFEINYHPNIAQINCWSFVTLLYGSFCHFLPSLAVDSNFSHISSSVVYRMSLFRLPTILAAIFLVFCELLASLFPF